MNILLYPLSLMYGAAARLDRALTRPVKLPRPVISIGNVTWGGTGKTPCVLKLAEEFVALGFKPAVLSRGYFRKDKKSSFVAVSDGKNTLVPPELSGDEPYLIAKSVPGAVVMAGKNRLAAAGYAMEKFSPDIFILDDGFQHWKIQRDQDIVCVSALNPFGNGSLIPAGILREPLSALKRADLVVLNSSDMVAEDELAKIEAAVSVNSGAKIIRAKYSPRGIIRVADGKSFRMEELKGEPFTAVSAIGDNSGFKKMLEKSGINAVEHIAFRDHHWYNIADIGSLDKSRAVVTTTKDAVRLKSLIERMPMGEAQRFYALNIELVFVNGAGIWEKSTRKMPRSS